MVNVDHERASGTFREHSDGKAGCQTWGGAVQRKKDGFERWVRAGQDITNRGLHPYVALSSPTRPRDWSIGHLEILCPKSPSGEPAPIPRVSLPLSHGFLLHTLLELWILASLCGIGMKLVLLEHFVEVCSIASGKLGRARDVTPGQLKDFL